MADDKLGIDIQVKNVDGAISSLKDLKTALKGAKDEQVEMLAKFGDGSKEYKAAAQRVSELTDKVDDLRDASKQLQGTGVERSSQAFNNLGEGLRNLDFDKVKIGLGGLKTALASTGILLIVQAVSYLVSNFDELSKGSGILAKALQFVGSIITAITDAITYLTDKLGLTNSALDEQGEAIKTNAEASKAALDSQTAAYDRQIAVAKAAGQSTVAIEKAKQEAIIATSKAVVEQIAAFVRAGGELDDEKKKLLTANLDTIKNARVQEQIIDIEANKKSTEDYKKHLEDLKKLRQDYLAALSDLADQEVEVIRNSLAIQAEYKKELLDKEAKEQAKIDQANIDRDKQGYIDFQNRQAEKDALIEQSTQDRINALEAAKAAELNNDDLKEQDRVEIIKKYKQQETAINDEENQKQRASNQKKFDDTIAGTKAALQSTQAITDLFFQYQLNKNKGNAAAELEIRKKQFNVNKAFGITNSIIDGIGAVQKALNNPYPLNIILAVAAGVLATANTVKIAATKFDPGTSAASGGTAGGAIQIPQPPTVSTPDANVQDTKFDANGNTIKNTPINTTPVVKAVVVETDITDTQKRVNKVQQQSTF